MANVIRGHSGHRHCGRCAGVWAYVRAPLKHANVCTQAYYGQLNIVEYLVSRKDLDNTMNDVHRSVWARTARLIHILERAFLAATHQSVNHPTNQETRAEGMRSQRRRQGQDNPGQRLRGQETCLMCALPGPL